MKQYWPWFILASRWWIRGGSYVYMATTLNWWKRSHFLIPHLLNQYFPSKFLKTSQVFFEFIELIIFPLWYLTEISYQESTHTPNVLPQYFLAKCHKFFKSAKLLKGTVSPNVSPFHNTVTIFHSSITISLPDPKTNAAHFRLLL